MGNMENQEIKKETKTIVVWVTRDGKEHDTEYQAKNHLKELVFNEARKTFLEEKLNELIGDPKIKAQILNVEDTSESIFNPINVKILYQPNQSEELDDPWIEPNEYMPIDWHKWYRIQKEMKLKYAFQINIPTWYWSK